MPSYSEPEKHVDVAEIVALGPLSVEIAFDSDGEGEQRAFRVHARENLRGEAVSKFYAEYEEQAFVRDEDGRVIQVWCAARRFIMSAWSESPEAVLDEGIGCVCEFMRRTADESAT